MVQDETTSADSPFCNHSCRSLLEPFGDSVRHIEPKPHRFKAGELISFHREEGAGIFYIEKGFAKLSLEKFGKRRPILLCGPGDVMGVTGDLTLDDHLSATAMEPVHACFYTLGDFQRVNASLDSLGCKKVSGTLFERIWNLESRSAKTRIVSTLYMLLETNRRTSQTATNYLVSTDRKTLAEMSSTVVETLSRTLTELEQDGVISRDQRRIRVLDEEKLKELLKEE